MIPEDKPAVSLRHLLLAVGDPLVELDAGTADASIRAVVVLDVDEEPEPCPQALAVVIGARGRHAVRNVRAAGRAGASAVAVKTAGDVDELRAAAQEAGVTLLAVRPQARWEQLLAVLRGALDDAAVAADHDVEHGDLFALAQTVAILTSGSVTIEDTGNRVLAYSRSDDDIDELRRRSILGWEGPQEYLAHLREWGVFQRLRSSEEVVRVEERPELGIRRRLAIGIRAGVQYLGAIWVQEGRQPLAERAEDALVGAARVAAVQLVRRRGAGGRPKEELLADLLDGRISADLVAGRLGLDPAASAIVVAFALRDADRDRSAGELHRAEIGNVVTVQAAAYRRDALVGAIGSRVYAIVPDIGDRQSESALSAMVGHVVAVLERRGVSTQVGIGSPVTGLGQVTLSRIEADRVLDALVRAPSRAVARIADLRAEVLLGEILGLLQAKPELTDPGVAALAAHDDAHGTDLAISLLAYLDALGDIRVAAQRLRVHPNTLRHRLRRAAAIGGIDLADPHERLCCHLHLLLAGRTR